MDLHTTSFFWRSAELWQNETGAQVNSRRYLRAMLHHNEIRSNILARGWLPAGQLRRKVAVAFPLSTSY
jgi:hypothetical protein